MDHYRKRVSTQASFETVRELKERAHELGLGLWWDSLLPSDQKQFEGHLREMVSRHVARALKEVY